MGTKVHNGVARALVLGGLGLVALSTACATNTIGWIETNDELVAADPGFFALSKERRVMGLMPLPETYQFGRCEAVDLAVLITDAELWVGISTGERRRILKTSTGHDWAAFAETLEEYSEYPRFQTPHYRYIQLAADESVQYREILSAVDVSVASEFTEISYRDPQDLDVRFAAL